MVIDRDSPEPYFIEMRVDDAVLDAVLIELIDDFIRVYVLVVVVVLLLLVVVIVLLLLVVVIAAVVVQMWI
jgi:hypothetical protein